MVLRCPGALLGLRCCWWCVFRLLVCAVLCCDRVRRFFAARRVTCRRSCRGCPAAAGRLPFCLDSLCGAPAVILVKWFNLRFSTFGKFGGISGFFRGCGGGVYIPPPPGFLHRRGRCILSLIVKIWCPPLSLIVKIIEKKFVKMPIKRVKVRLFLI